MKAIDSFFTTVQQNAPQSHKDEKFFGKLCLCSSRLRKRNKNANMFENWIFTLVWWLSIGDSAGTKLSLTGSDTGVNGSASSSWEVMMISGSGAWLLPKVKILRLLVIEELTLEVCVVLEGIRSIFSKEARRVESVAGCRLPFPTTSSSMSSIWDASWWWSKAKCAATWRPKVEANMRPVGASGCRGCNHRKVRMCW